MGTFLFIHVVVPLFGFAEFLLLAWRLDRAKLAGSLVVPYFLIHFFYGGLLLILLTAFFWSWSGMASLGALLCVLVGPAVLIAQAWWLNDERRASKFHGVAWFLSLTYPLCVALLIGIGRSVAP